MKTKTIITAVIFAGSTVSLVAQNSALSDMWNQSSEAAKRFQKGFQESDGYTADRVIEGLIETATPEADENTRRVQRAAVKYLLDPDSSRTDQHWQDMVKGVRAQPSPERSPAANRHSNAPSSPRRHHQFYLDATGDVGAGDHLISKEGLTYCTNRNGAERSALRFRGDGKYFRIAQPLLRQSSFTIALWFRIDNATGKRYLFCQGGNPGQKEVSPGLYVDYANLNGRARFFTYDRGGYDLFSKTSFAVGKWYHVCVVDDGATRTLYVNGKAEDSGRGFPFGAKCPNTYLGGNPAYNEHYLDGAIDDVLVAAYPLPMTGVSFARSGPSEPPAKGRNSLRATGEAAERLRQLERLHNEGLIDQEEYRRKREEIIQSL